MPRISEVLPEQAPSEVRALFDRQMEENGFLYNTTKVYAHVPSIMFAASALGNAIRGESHVEQEILSMVNVRAAKINGCPF